MLLEQPAIDAQSFAALRHKDCRCQVASQLFRYRSRSAQQFVCLLQRRNQHHEPSCAQLKQIGNTTSPRRQHDQK